MTSPPRLTAGAEDENARLDHYLVRHLSSTLSRSAIQRAIAAGAVTIAGRPVKANRRLKPGETIDVAVEQLDAGSPPSTWEPEEIPLTVVHEDDDVLVINKPAGLVTHPAPGHWSGTLVNAVLWHLRQVPSSKFQVQKSEPLPRAGIVHRLDKDTSGLLVVAKTDLALRDLGAQLKSRTLGRTYLALVEGHLPFDEGTIDAAIGRHLTHRTEMAIRHLGGREAVTRYRVRQRLEREIPRTPGQQIDTPPSLRYSALEITLQTGRTHQIRVHVAHLGYPVLGDIVYSHHPDGFWRLLGISRQLLHAWRIRFVHPVSRRTLEFGSPVPDDMQRWLAPPGAG